MADHLTEIGFEVVDRQPGDRTPDGAFTNPTLGTLTLVRYGHTITATVRVDGAGEVFVRADWTDRDDEDRGPGTDLAIRAQQLRKAPA